MDEPTAGERATDVNRGAYRQLLETGPNRRDLGAIDRLVAPDFVGHWLFNAPALVGPAAFRQWLVGTLTAFPDWHIRLDDILAEGDRVAGRWTAHGTETGTRRDPAGQVVPGSGCSLHLHGIHIARFTRGQLVELWHSQDLLSTYQQLGVLPDIPH